MLRSTWATWTTHGRRGALIGASAAVVCLGGVLAACAGGDPDGGYVAVGAAGGRPPPSATAAAPTGEVTLVPLDGGGEKDVETTPNSREQQGISDSGEAPGPSGAASPPSDGAKSGRTTANSPSAAASSPSGSGRTTPSGPAVLSWGEPVRAATDEPWCEDVTVVFRNSGGSAVRSGTVTFGTHIIGALGIDWATVESAADLPAPIAAGEREKKTWTVCVDAWRVPLGMHIETRDVAVEWK